MKFKNKTELTDACLEFDSLYVEWEITGSLMQPESDWSEISIINVQLPSASDPDNTDLWLDITDHISIDQEQSLIQQVAEHLEDQSYD